MSGEAPSRFPFTIVVNPDVPEDEILILGPVRVWPLIAEPQGDRIVYRMRVDPPGIIARLINVGKKP